MIVRRSGGSFRLAIIVCVVAFPCAAPAQTTGSMRTWSDSSGRHKREAAFVRIEADSVYLKSADGQMIVLPLARLSEEDRDYVAKLSEGSAPATSPDAGVLPQLRSASVVVWWQRGERVIPVPGIVLRKDGERAFVVVKGTKPNTMLDWRGPESFSVAADDTRSRVPAEWHGVCAGGSMTMLVAPAGQLPDPLPPASAALPVRGRFVTVIGWQTKSGSLPSAARVEQTASVHRIFRTIDGTVASIRIEAPPPVPILGLVANEEGQFVGIVKEEVRPVSLTRSRSEPRPPRFHSAEPAAAFLGRLAQP
jgi:hypothetical protein